MPLTTWTCHQCGAEHRSWSAAERHANEVHHGGRTSIAVPARGAR